MKHADGPAQAKRWLAAGLIAATAMLFTLVPAYQLLWPGPFDWHVRQPQVVQGGAEALVLALVSMACMAANSRRAFAVLLLVGLAYLRRHAADVPLLLDAAYFEILVGLGFFIGRWTTHRTPGSRDVDYLRAMTLGLVGWSVGAWALAAAGVGSIAALQAYSLLLALPALLGRKAPFLLQAVRNARAWPLKDRLWCGLMLAWGLVLFARAKVVVGYDAMWYGLRGELVLDPGASFLQGLNLVSPVYYFPKLYEVLLLPLSGLGDFGVIQGMTVVLLLPLAVVAFALLDRLSAPRFIRWPLVALVLTTPALSNMAVTPKPDVLAALFVLLAALEAIDWNRRRRPEHLAWFAACMLLAVSSKLVAIPYVAVLAAALVAKAALSRAPCAPSPPFERRLAWIALGGACLVACAVAWRTWRLTGVPTVGPDALVRVWNALGFGFVEPAGSLHWMFPVDWAGMPALVLDVLMRPQHRMPHMIVTWVGNAWAWMALVWLLAFLVRRARCADAAPLPLPALAATGACLFVFVGYSERGSDGNYFIYAIVPALLVAGRGAARALGDGRVARWVLETCMLGFVALYAGYAFVSAGWTPGTRAWDLDFRRDWRGAAASRQQTLREFGLERIGDDLRRNAGPTAHVVGSTIETAGNWLPARYESLQHIGFARPEYVSSEAAFRAFIARFGIRYLVLIAPAEEGKAYPNTVPTPPAAVKVFFELAALRGARLVEDRKHLLLDLSAVADAELQAP